MKEIKNGFLRENGGDMTHDGELMLFTKNAFCCESHAELMRNFFTVLTAPRPLYVASASNDEWSDPNAELLSCRLASEVYELYGKRGVVVDDEVKENFAYHDGMIGYHRKTGDHAIEKYDWRMFLDFADRKFK